MRQSFVILALNQPRLVDDLKIFISQGFNVTCLKGVYKGQRENSYRVDLESMNDDNLQKLIDLANQYNQESILIVDEYNEGQLLFLKSGAIEYVGQWTEIDKITAQKNDNYTYDYFNNKYFLCKKD